ncbi:hypothetical protein VTH8203_03157 [Vibrio thalassae]|uniref:Uncharacterized protein n=1 Tax=Vibrio thalassae TaxID=1243014 RepID=A0A240EMW6_9VIBR|nr:hypothetical protein VTH8203_03157 [Vibrio thalassae]
MRGSLSAELQAMVKALMASENRLKQERQSLLEQLKLAFERQFAKRSEALKPYDVSQGDLFNEEMSTSCLIYGETSIASMRNYQPNDDIFGKQ